MCPTALLISRWSLWALSVNAFAIYLLVHLPGRLGFSRVEHFDQGSWYPIIVHMTYTPIRVCVFLAVKSFGHHMANTPICSTCVCACDLERTLAWQRHGNVMDHDRTKN